MRITRILLLDTYELDEIVYEGMECSQLTVDIL